MQKRSFRDLDPPPAPGHSSKFVNRGVFDIGANATRDLLALPIRVHKDAGTKSSSANMQGISPGKPAFGWSDNSVESIRHSLSQNVPANPARHPVLDLLVCLGMFLNPANLNIHYTLHLLYRLDESEADKT